MPASPRGNRPVLPVRAALPHPEEHKKHTSSLVMALRRYILRFRMLPQPAQLAIVGSCFVIGSFLMSSSLASSHSAVVDDDDTTRASLLSTKHARSDHFHKRQTPDTGRWTMKHVAQPRTTEKQQEEQVVYPEHYKKRNLFPDHPRPMQLLLDPMNANSTSMRALPLESPELPLFGSHMLVGKYIPLPQPKRERHKEASKLDKGACHPTADWQRGHLPTCNLIHDASWGWNHMFSDRVNDVEEDDDSLEQARLVGGGNFRNVWMIRDFDGTKMALKTLRVDDKGKDFDLRSFDRHRRDSMAFEQLTRSPLVVNIYGFCSNSALFDWGEGGVLKDIFDVRPDIPKEQLLEIAYNVSLSIAHAHHFDDQGRATIAHTDIKPDQFLYQDGYYKLTDFNRARFLLWNERQNGPCGFKVGKNGGIWRSPEEYAYKQETEKVDVYSLGNILYFLLTREEPWADFRTKEVYDLVQRGKRPEIPPDTLGSDHPFDQYMVKAIEMAFVHEAVARPGALEIANKLKEGMGKLKTSNGQ